MGGAYSAAMNNAVKSMVQSGDVFAAVAAGSGATDVGNFSPGSEPTACTAGATGISDNVSSGSNTGPLLDVWAPGERITTTWLNDGVVSFCLCLFCYKMVLGGMSGVELT